MKKYKFQGLSGSDKPIKIERGVKKVKQRPSWVQRRMNRPSKLDKACRGYEKIFALVERAVSIQSKKSV